MNYSTNELLPRAAGCLPAGILLFCAQAFAEEPGHAAAEGHHGVDFSTLIFPGMNFLIYMAFIVYLYRRYGRPALRDYSARVRARLEHAGSQLLLARDELRQIDERLTNIQGERSALLAEIEREGDRMVETVIASAKKSAVQKDADTERQIETEFAVARAEVRAEIVARGAARAREKLQAGLTAEEDRSIRRSVLNALRQ